MNKYLLLTAVASVAVIMMTLMAVTLEPRNMAAQLEATGAAPAATAADRHNPRFSPAPRV
jgi:hypothetical protein